MRYLVVYEYRTRHLDVLTGYSEIEANSVKEAKNSALKLIGVYRILTVGKIIWKCEER